MTVQSAQWTDESRTMIAATIDDVEGMFVPDDPANRFRQQIAAWEAEGNVIAPPPAEAGQFTAQNYRAQQERKMDAAAASGDFATAFSILTDLTGV
jgi:hypothetical protein